MKLPDQFRTLEELGITKKQLVGHMKGLYQGELRYVDEYIRKLWESLGKKELLKNTLVVITSDHGEEFLEHGYLSHNGFNGGKEEMVRIPLIMAFPGSDRDFHHKRITNLVRMVDIAPTILNCLSLDQEARESMDGKSLIPLMEGKSDPQRYAWMEDRSFQMLRTSGWKLIRSKGNDWQQLFDLKKDPGEQVNVAAENPRKIQEMTESFQDLSRLINVESHPDSAKSNQESTVRLLIDEKTRKRLSALGYAQ